MGNLVDCMICFDFLGLIIIVKIGDMKGGGLYNIVYLIFIDDRGNRLKELCL